MGAYSYLILGTGVGKNIAWNLMQYEDTRAVFIADQSAERARDIARELNQTDGFGRCLGISIDLSRDPDRIKDFLPGMHVVVSAIPAKYDPLITRECIEAGVHSCNLGAVLEKTREQLKMHEAAKRAGSCIVTDTGVDPGLMNVWLRVLRSKFKEPPERMFMFAGGVPQYPVPPSNYGRMYAAEGTWHMVFDPVTRVRDGKIEQVRALDTFGKMPTPVALAERGLAVYSGVEMFESSGAALAPWDMKHAGVKNLTAWTIRWPGFKQFVLEHSNEASFRNAFEMLPPTDAEHPDILYACVGAEWKKLTGAYELVETFDHAEGFSAMQKATGIPAAVTAQMLAHGNLAEGVHTADRALYDAGLVNVYLNRVKKVLPFTYTEVSW